MKRVSEAIEPKRMIMKVDVKVRKPYHMILLVVVKLHSMDEEVFEEDYKHVHDKHVKKILNKTKEVLEEDDVQVYVTHLTMKHDEFKELFQEGDKTSK